MRSIWKGHLSFGLVNIPVKLYPAVSREDLSFRFLHKKDRSPITYERVCEKDGKEVPWDDVVKGYEYEKGKFVVLTDEDFKRADVEATRTIDILDFVNADEVDMVYFDKPYYLEPDRGGDKPYVLLREALRSTKRVGIAKVVIRTRQHLAAVKPSGEALVMNLMRFHEELVDPAELEFPSEADLNRKELTMAERLIENLSEPFDPLKYTDDYRGELLRVIREKLEGKEVQPVEEGDRSPQVIDIMSALKASLAQTRRQPERRGKGGDGAGRVVAGRHPGVKQPAARAKGPAAAKKAAASAEAKKVRKAG